MALLSQHSSLSSLQRIYSDAALPARLVTTITSEYWSSCSAWLAEILLTLILWGRTYLSSRRWLTTTIEWESAPF